MPSLPTCIGHEVGGEKAELFILRLRIRFWTSELFLTELTWVPGTGIIPAPGIEMKYLHLNIVD